LCSGRFICALRVEVSAETGNPEIEMEQLLNLAWLLLALPAYWLWRRGTRRFSSLQCLASLGCLLVLLFPVISASDDLHAMQTEMEDSSVSKRTVCQAASDKNSGWLNRMHGPPAALASVVRLVAPKVGLLEVSTASESPLARSCVFRWGRAPPFSPLG
jgi:hypothetical protein